jgi:hypothetical protein
LSTRLVRRLWSSVLVAPLSARLSRLDLKVASRVSGFHYLLSQIDWFLQLAVYGWLFCSSFSRVGVGWVHYLTSGASSSRGLVGWFLQLMVRVSLVRGSVGFSNRLRLWLPLRCEFLSRLDTTGFSSRWDLAVSFTRVSLVFVSTGFSSWLRNLLSRPFSFPPLARHDLSLRWLRFFLCFHSSSCSVDPAGLIVGFV